MNGFLTKEIYYPAQDIFIALFCNSENAPRDDLSVELGELALGVSFQKGINVQDNLLEKYTGTYYLGNDTRRTLTITKEGDHLIGKVSGQSSYELLFQSDVDFQFKHILNAKCRFKIVNGKVVSFIVNQGAEYEWKR